MLHHHFTVHVLACNLVKVNVLEKLEGFIKRLDPKLVGKPLAVLVNDLLHHVAARRSGVDLVHGFGFGNLLDPKLDFGGLAPEAAFKLFDFHLFKRLHNWFGWSVVNINAPFIQQGSGAVPLRFAIYVVFKCEFPIKPEHPVGGRIYYNALIQTQNQKKIMNGADVREVESGILNQISHEAAHGLDDEYFINVLVSRKEVHVIVETGSEDYRMSFQDKTAAIVGASAVINQLIY